jgi:L-threonylcarbamoyladenylate synthase
MITLTTASANYPSKTAACIKKGGLVVFPSDTVYILAVDPQNPSAVQKLLSFKNRWAGKAISIAVFDVNMAKKYVKLNKTTIDLYRHLLPGPFTLISPGRHLVATGIEAENGSLGIRIPASNHILNLVKLLGFPITATSANLSGRTPHYSLSSFLNTLSLKKQNLIDLAIDGGQLPRRQPSTVIDVSAGDIKILRRGDLTTVNSQTLLSSSETDTKNIASFLFEKSINLSQTRPIVFALFSRQIGKNLGVSQIITSPTFVIYNQYQANFSNINHFFHFDLYRLSSDYEFKEIDFLSHFKTNTFSCIEWPENMGQKNIKWLKKHTCYFSVNFEYLSQTKRQLSFSF